MKTTDSRLLRTFVREYYRQQRLQSCSCRIPATQCHILNALGDAGGTLPQSELTAYLGLEKSWISRAVESLASDGSLIKSKCCTDARCSTLTLTEAGKKRYEKLNAVLDAQAAGIINNVPSPERDNVSVCLRLLADALTKTSSSCSCGKQPDVPIVIRQAEKDDLAGIKSLLKSRHLPFEDLTADALSFFIIAVSGNKTAGCAGFEAYGNYALLRSVAVAEEAAGCGTGRALVAAVEKKMAASGIQSVFLLTTDAVSFWIHSGYTVVERDSAPSAVQNSFEYKSACPRTAQLMNKQLEIKHLIEGKK